MNSISYTERHFIYYGNTDHSMRTRWDFAHEQTSQHKYMQPEMEIAVAVVDQV